MRLLPAYAAGFLVILGAVTALALATHRPAPVGPADLLGIIPGLPQLVGVTVIPNSVAWTLVVEMAFYTVCLVLHRSLLGRRWVLLSVAVGCIVIQQGFLALDLRTYPLAGLSDLMLVAVPFIPILLIGVGLDSLDPGRRISGRDWTALLLLVGSFWWMSGFKLWWPFSPSACRAPGLPTR